MPIDPSLLPPAAAPDPSPDAGTATVPAASATVESAVPVAPLQSSSLAFATPHMGHTLLFGVCVLLASALIGVAFAFSLKHITPYVHETTEQMQTDPRIVIPVEAVVYAVAAGASLLLFPLLWGRSFAQGVHWRSAIVQRRWWLLVGIGIATSVTVQLLSNFLPIPKELPIDKFFTNRIGVWLVAIFGVTVAPAFEELAFRGFLLPSLATAWDWVAQRSRAGQPLLPGRDNADRQGDWQAESAVYTSLPSTNESVFHRPGPTQLADTAERSSGNAERGSGNPDPRWSAPATVFATIITSVAFAFLHSDQLAHSLAPLGVLFVVSVVLSVTRLRFHSLAASTLVHSMYNATIFAMLFIGTDGFWHLDKLGK